MRRWVDLFLGQLMTIVMVSLIISVSSLPIITFFPTSVSLLGILYFYDQKSEWSSRLEAFGYFFKKHFIRSLFCQLGLTLVLIIGTLNISMAATMSQTAKIVVGIFSVFFMGLMGVTIANLLFSLVINPADKFSEQCRKALLLVFIKMPQTLLLIVMFTIGGVIIFLIPQTMIIVVGLVFWCYYLLEKRIWHELLVLDSAK